jgi:GxxExxY protein
MSQQDFARLDYEVMRHAFECQNKLGRLCDEVIYQNDLAARLQAAGFTAHKEIPVTVTHRDFAKTYALDLVVAEGCIYELKTVRELPGEHEAQLLNYLFLCGAAHGKLINFRPPQVQSRYVNTTLTHAVRRQFEIKMEDWQERDQTEQVFRENLVGLLQDWGGWLDLALYTEALIHFAGGKDRVVLRVPLTRGEVRLGTQRWFLLNPETAFWVTGLTEGTADYEQHLRALLGLTPLRTIQWVNLARQHVRLASLTR